MGPLRWARRIAVLLAVSALGLMLAPAAVAGGPTSVMIIEYPQGRATALRMDSTAYGDLQRLMAADSPPQGTAKPPSGLNPDQPSLHSVRMTWFLHDVRAWRADQVFFGKAPKDVWIHSRVDQADTPSASEGPKPADGWLAAEGIWHRPADGPGLRRLLRTLGLSLDSGSASATGAVPDSSTPPPTTALSPAGSITATSTPSPGIGENWWWSLPGLAAGAAAALLLRSSAVPPLPELLRKLPGRGRPGPK
ncbi:hypothetical protein [Streptomyces qinzhouensis]|uniref:DUF2207 domain-containing protein n=1 Tax=Streptomyces qinzhouensis TaxID=2599401 RepID=A0A5B8IJ85_9ACTN|nr:hypothetical protein [Streptomyces qinzhouensis]QDY78628.1 hypothetical protein FQU76_21290 [Streptomyces qinzhouensis]